MRKDPSVKSTKTFSKRNHSNRDGKEFLERQLRLPKNSGMELIANLQRLIQTEITTREQSYLELLGMINHLRETKKSKVPVRYEKMVSKKFFSPHKTDITQENYENGLIAQRVSSLQQPLFQEKIRSQIEQVDEEVRAIRKKMENIEEISDRQKLIAQGEISGIKNDLQLEKKIDQRKLTKHLKNLMKEQLNRFSEIVENRMEKEFCLVWKGKQNIEKAARHIQQSVSIFEERVEKELRIASENILMTKETIEEIFFGSSSLNEKYPSSVSIECDSTQNQQIMKAPKKNQHWNPVGQKLDSLEIRVDSLERRFSFFVENLLSKPVNCEFEEPLCGFIDKNS